MSYKNLEHFCLKFLKSKFNELNYDIYIYRLNLSRLLQSWTKIVAKKKNLIFYAVFLPPPPPPPLPLHQC